MVEWIKRIQYSSPEVSNKEIHKNFQKCVRTCMKQIGGESEDKLEKCICKCFEVSFKSPEKTTILNKNKITSSIMIPIKILALSVDYLSGLEILLEILKEVSNELKINQ